MSEQEESILSLVRGGIDPGVERLVCAMNRYPDTITVSSCDGVHRGNCGLPHVLFDYDGPEPIPWMLGLFRACEGRERLCLGCLRLKIAKVRYSDCAGDVRLGRWEITIEPRGDYGPLRDEHVLWVWDTLAAEFEKGATLGKVGESMLKMMLRPVVQWPSLSFTSWSGAAGRFGCYSRFWFKGHWTPLCWNWKRFGLLGLYRGREPF